MSSEEEIILFQFFIKFCQKLEQGENIVCSPLSVGSVLALLALASEGQGRQEILDVFGVPNYGKIQKLFRKTQILLKSRRGIFLTVANKIYIRDDLEVINVVIREAKTTCETSIEKISFVDPIRAQATINAWVTKKTRNKIPEMFSPNEFTNYTCFVLVNAIYFSGTWKNQFNPMKTKPGIFLVDATTTSTVPMMNSEAEFRYGNSDALKAKMLEMPYDAGDATTLVVLPDEIEGLKDLLEKLSEGYNLMPEIQRMNKKKLRVSIPRFKVETEIDLVDYLPKIGISSIFGENFGLSRFVNSSQPLVISKAVQRTVVEFNERGFRAASATSMQVRPIHEEFFDEFLADHPFLVITFIQQLPYFFILYYGAGHDSHSESELEIKKKRCVIS